MEMTASRPDLNNPATAVGGIHPRSPCKYRLRMTCWWNATLTAVVAQSVPPRGSGWVRSQGGWCTQASGDVGYVAFFYPAVQCTSWLRTHPLPRGGTDCFSPKRLTHDEAVCF